jgi:RimJ/RimL family protein N-acetyltransferase
MMTETFPRLESKRLSLRVLELSDAQRLFEIFSQQRVVEDMELDPRFWGQAFMAEVMPHLEAYGFEALGLRRLEAMVTPGNERSCLLLERHGFQREGILRDYARWKGQFWDQWIYAKLGGEGRVAT